MIFFFLPLRHGRIESSKENRLQAGWHAGVVLGKCEVRGACSLFLFLSLRPSSFFFLPPSAAPSAPETPHALVIRRCYLDGEEGKTEREREEEGERGG